MVKRCGYNFRNLTRNMVFLALGALLWGWIWSCHPRSSQRRGGDEPSPAPVVKKKGQDRLLAHVRQCSDQPGALRSVDGSAAIETGDSEKHVFLRCIFHGGQLEHCIAQNECQVVMDAQSCQKELEQLQEAYPEIEQKWHCRNLNLPQG